MSLGLNFSGLTESLAKTAHDFHGLALPQDVKIRARHSLLDWFSLVLSAGKSSELGYLRAYYDSSDSEGDAHCTVFFQEQQMTPQAAMMLNGIAGHLQDFDDTHLVSRVHPSVPLWPVLWCEAERRELTGEQLLRAFVAGVQVQSQLAQVMGERHYALGWHNTATLGAFGATAALGVARGLSIKQLRQAFGFVATQVGGLRKVFGSIAKPVQVARASVQAYESVGWAEFGLSSVDDVLDGVLGFTNVYGGQPQDLLGLKVNHWWVRDILFKYHASCYGTQAPIQAALELGPQSLEVVREVQVFIEPQYMSVCNIASPVTVNEAKFSVRHMVAMVLAEVNTASEESIAMSLKDENILQWREKIQVKSCVELTRAKAKIILGLKTGEAVEYFFDASRPESDLNTEARQLIEKSQTILLESAWPGEFVSWLQSELLSIDSCTDIAQWLARYRSRLKHLAKQ